MRAGHAARAQRRVPTEAEFNLSGVGPTGVPKGKALDRSSEPADHGQHAIDFHAAAAAGASDRRDADSDLRRHLGPRHVSRTTPSIESGIQSGGIESTWRVPRHLDIVSGEMNACGSPKNCDEKIAVV